jgi:hypothetical protein
VLVEMWCPVVSPSHVLIGHILPVLVLAVLGALLGARLIAMHGARRDR